MKAPMRDTLVICQITRQSVEQCDIQPALSMLDPFTSNAARVRGHVGSLALVFDGYDADERELVEIPEVCRYAERLCSAWPYWAAFAERLQTVPLLMALCSPSTALAGADGVFTTAVRDERALLSFIEQQCAGLESLCDRQGIEEAFCRATKDDFIAAIQSAFVHP